MSSVVWLVYYDCQTIPAGIPVPFGWPPPGGVKELVAQIPIFNGPDSWAQTIASGFAGTYIAQRGGWIAMVLPAGSSPPLNCP
jgi:hypothetical protein